MQTAASGVRVWVDSVSDFKDGNLNDENQLPKFFWERVSVYIVRS